jgi:hypothetical protein
MHAYDDANRHLLNLIIGKFEIANRLKSAKSFFFLGNADFMVQFLDYAFDSLRHPVNEIPASRLQSLFEISVAESAPFKDDYRVRFASSGLVEQLLKIVNLNAAEKSASRFELSTAVAESRVLTGRLSYKYDIV